MTSTITAKKLPRKLSMHGHERVDNYYWLRDDSKGSKEVLDYLNSENEYCREALAHTENLQKSLYQEIVSRHVKSQVSVPVERKKYCYYHEFSGNAEYPKYWRSVSKSGEQKQLLLDANQRAIEHNYYKLAPIAISEDEHYAAIPEDTNGDRVYSVSIKNINNDSYLPDKLNNTSGEIIWCNSNNCFYYVKMHSETLLPYQVFRHYLGKPQSEDTLVYEEPDQSFYTQIAKSKDKSWIYIYHSSTETNAVSILNADNESSSPKKILPRETGHQYWVEISTEKVFILTNWQAKNFKLVEASLDRVNDKSGWLTIVNHDSEILLEDFELFSEYLVYKQRRRGLLHFTVRELSTGNEQPLAFTERAYSADFKDNTELETGKVRISYTSLTTPESIIEFDLAKATPSILKQESVNGGFLAENYQSSHIEVLVRDGEKVPVTLVYRKDCFQEKENPLFIEGYGAYGINIDPKFSYCRLSLLDRGFVYAFPHVRGSSMLGRDWYEQGKMLNKKNSFSDFIDVTIELTKLGYAASDKVFATGESAGGLLVSAVINQAPQLYKGCSVHVPFVDVLTSMLDESLPLTCGEFDEWGNPKIKEHYEYILSYSPYDQVKRQDYPHMLVTSGLYDSQVQYFEPAKWVAKLRDYKTDNNTLLFNIDMNVGHAGQSGRFNQYREIAMEYAFFLDLLAKG